MLTKSAFISIVGPSNAGKSTIVNALVGSKISIVTHKVQTTHGVVRGVFTKDDVQLIFLDTPGIFVPKFALEKKMVNLAWRALRGIDIVLVVIDAQNGITSNVSKLLTKLSKGAIILINKIDLIDQGKLIKMMACIADLYGDFGQIFPISAVKNRGLEVLKEYLMNNAPYGPWHFDSSVKSDAPLDFILAEITREKLFLRVHKELPYSSVVKTEIIKEEEDGLLVVHQTIYVISENHKKIIIGKLGDVIKNIRMGAMKEMSDLLNKRVNLFLFVKVKPDWQDDKEILATISYL